MRPDHLALFTASLRVGGVERLVINLSAEFARRGYLVDVVLARAEGPFLNKVHAGVRVVDLNSRRVLTSLPGLVRYLRHERPASLLTLQTHCNIVAVIATALVSRPARLVVSEHNSVSARTARGFSEEALLLRFTGLLYPRAQGIVAVSSGLAGELSEVSGQERGRIKVIPNAVATDELRGLAETPLDHPWFGTGEPPVVLSVGRLVPQKDHATIMRAFARLRQRRAARLLIIGEGPERQRLEALAKQLGVEADFSLPGFDTNPYRFMRRCGVFVLSSAWEGFGNVLVEAMACGAPVVSTDCHSGPSEILEQGKYGPLVPVGDDGALAGALEQMIDSPTSAEILTARASDFSIARGADEYLKLLLPGAK